ncbi:dihydrolipoyllysine-residue acetyltransferase [Candidatus Profftella armatura (Diaphorina cf. continua)]|uniref:Dihydrolipoamide acetyltransferase component of pyruvate dehydrogenase complex n=1 Tax=Candidatus Profftella armatura (Diaphorina cf. continua) TaxID=2661583 RepID=A0A7R7ABP6_9PROT|nr:2-oxo acid dehydrogenase subunit E2 [Candidatus Profftella armatura (Diaphorina cf. continua)]BCG49593.1 dihydrolipoyllysine-residue acetyltransferase [Candidatus Profftella armatura (Diaphorina cf. continua)]
MNEIIIKVPDIGDFSEVEVIELMVKIGDTIKIDQSLLVVESEKVSMEIPSSHNGIVREIKVKVGDKVSKNSQILILEEFKENKKNIKSSPEKLNNFSKINSSPLSLENSINNIHASPSVRKFAREIGVDLKKITLRTGPKNRILKEDIKNYVSLENIKKKECLFSDFLKFGNIEFQPLSRITKISGQNLYRTWTTIPHVTQFDEADVTELEKFRKNYNNISESNEKLTILSFIVKSVAYILKKYPKFNSSLDSAGENLILKKYYHIGFAVDTKYGLMVPVIKDADQKTITQISQEIINLSNQARKNKLNLSNIQGSTFTISSLGGIGGTAFTPIINSPEVAILGISKIIFKPIWNNTKFIPRMMLPLSLSYDHRVIDGAMSANFSNSLSNILSDIRKIIL